MFFKSLFLLWISLYCLVLAGNKDENIIAEIGDNNILLKDFSTRYSNYISSSGIADNLEVRRAILNNMILEILLKNYDDNSSVLNNTEYLKELEWTKNSAVLAYLKDKEIYANITATDDEIRKAFLNLNRQVLARHLYADTEEKAQYLYDLLKMGVDFENLAAQVFIDSVLRNNGGSLGYFTWGDMNPAFEDAAFSLKPGEISRPVKTTTGYSIIRVDDIVETPIITENQFLQKKNQLHNAIRLRKKGPAERKYLSDLLNTDEIIFNEEILEGIVNKLNGVSSLENNTQEFSESGVCADYRGTVYTYADVMNRTDKLPGFHRIKINSVKNLKAIISGFFIQDTLLSIASKKGYDKNDEMMNVYSKMSNNLFFQYKKEEIFDKTAVADNEVLDYYHKNIHLFMKKNEISIREILVDNRKLADSLFERLNNGADFGELAKQYSKRQWSARNGGEIGYSPISMFGMLKEKLWNQTPGALVGPVEVENYFGIFQVIGKINGVPIEFDLVKNEAKNLLKEEKGREILQKYMDDLKAKVKIEINDGLLKSTQIAGR